MSTPTKKQAPIGREPIKNKKYEILKERDYTEQDKFALSQQQKDYLEENGLACRFIQQKTYLENNNFHRTGWTIVADPDMPGANADGLVKIGDLVLAVKTKTAQAAHRRALQAKAARFSDQTAVNKAAAVELRQAMDKARVSGQIHEGYEKNGDDEKDED